MPAWWSKKPLSSTKTTFEQHLTDRIAIADASWKPKGKSKSFDDVFGRRPKSRPSSSSGFDSDGGLPKRGHPLPRPSDLSAASSLPLLDQTTPGSASVSSVSSSGSFDETPDLGFRYSALLLLASYCQLCPFVVVGIDFSFVHFGGVLVSC